MPSSGPRWAWWRTTMTSAPDSSAFSVARSAGARRPRRAAASRRAPPRGSRDVVAPGGRAAAGAEALLERGRALALAPALVLLDLLGGGARGRRRRSRPRRRADVAGEPLPQVRVQVALELADGLVAARRSAGARSPRAFRRSNTTGRVLEVVAYVLLDRALVARLRPAALPVLRVDVVLDAVGLLERAGVPVKMRALRRLASSTHQRPPPGRPSSGSTNGVASITTFEASGCGTRTVSSRPAGPQAKTATARAPSSAMSGCSSTSRTASRSARSAIRSSWLRSSSSSILWRASFISEVISLARAGGVPNSDGSRSM